MKFTKALALLTAAALLTLTACKKAPEEVKRENEILNEATGDNAQTELKFATLQEIRAEVREVNKNNSTNVQVVVVRVGEGDAMPAFRVKKYVDNYDKLEDLIEYCYGEDMSAHPERLTVYDFHKEDFPGTDCKGAVVYIPEDGDLDHSLISEHCGGFGISYDKTGEYSDYWSTVSYPLIKEYRIYMGEDPGDDSYVMCDGKELKVADAIKNIETLYNEHIALLIEGELTYKVKEIDVHRYEDGTHGYSFDMEYCDRSGNIFMTCVETLNIPEDFDDEKAPWFYSSDCHGYYIGSKKMIYAYAPDFTCVDEITESGDKLLTYESALRQVSSKLATSSLYDMDIAALEYVYMFPPEKGYLEKDDKFGKPVGLYKDKYVHENGRYAQVRPYWVFRDLEKNGTSEAVYGGCVLVDALTGEVYVC